jgi:F-type H+-transporting ATPase subunit delta
MRISNYAKALFAIAKEQEKIDLLTFQFHDFMDLMDKNPNWIVLMDSPMISFAKKVPMIEALTYDASFLSFLKMLAEKNRLHFVKEIYLEWTELSRAYRKIAHLHVYSAKPLTNEQIEKLKVTLQPMFKNLSISFHVTVDPELLGGIKIVHHGQSLDRTVARELEELYTTI